tara:strand:- start:30 stop:263 length:234 start_codon:yes stop_codon:yes gene_type:complete
MTKKMYTVLRAGTYGKAGEVVELDIKDLTERQKIMLKPYEKPVVTIKSDGAELESALEEIEQLKLVIVDLEKDKKAK